MEKAQAGQCLFTPGKTRSFRTLKPSVAEFFPTLWARPPLTSALAHGTYRPNRAREGPSHIVARLGWLPLTNPPMHRWGRHSEPLRIEVLTEAITVAGGGSCGCSRRSDPLSSQAAAAAENRSHKGSSHDSPLLLSKHLMLTAYRLSTEKRGRRAHPAVP